MNQGSAEYRQTKVNRTHKSAPVEQSEPYTKSAPSGESELIMWINVPDETIITIENAHANGAVIMPLDLIYPLVGGARSIEAERAELDKYSKPIVPLDVPEPVWDAVAEHYAGGQWTPAPNHHPEYRDVRAAYIATLEFFAFRLHKQIEGYSERAG